MGKFLFLCVFLAAPAAVSAQDNSGGTASGTQSMNPDIGVVADFGAGLTSGFRKNEDDANRFKLRSAELVATQYVDSFGKLDLVASADEEALNVEEAYATIFELPLGTKLRAGKFFMKQKALIARALCCSRKAIFLDEPTSEVDKPSELDILEHLHRLNADKRITVLLVCHAIGAVFDYADTCLLAEHGNISVVSGETLKRIKESYA